MTIDYAQVAIQSDDFVKNNDMFDRLLSRDDLALVVLVENKLTGSRLIISNTHLFWNPAYSDVKLLQAGILMDSLKGIAQWFAQLPPQPPQPNGTTNGETSKPRPPPPPTYAIDGKDIPVVVAGDYNSIQDSGVYSFLSQGKVPGTHSDFKNYVYGKFTADGLTHDFGLRSVYADAGEVPVTNYTPTFREVIDYIFYNTSALTVNKVMGEVDSEYLSKVVGLPNAHFPSECVGHFLFFKSEASITDEIRTIHSAIFASCPSSVSRRNPSANNIRRRPKRGRNTRTMLSIY